jgi:hypothetical protein
MLFHGLNRGVGRMQIFRGEKDYDAFRRVVEETLRVAPHLRLLLDAESLAPRPAINASSSRSSTQASTMNLSISPYCPV